MREQMAESSPPRRNKQRQGEGEEEEESQRDVDLQLNESWNVI